MMLGLFSFGSPTLLIATLSAGAVAALIAWRRRVAVPAMTGVCGMGGLILLALAAGGLAWLGVQKQEVVVMVDLSASTRSADFRRSNELRKRIAALVGRTPHRVICFGQENRDSIEATPILRDLPGERTVFVPPAAAAIVLFSDGRFELPVAAPPTWCVIDPGLAAPADGAVTDLEFHGQTVAARVAQTRDHARTLSVAVDRTVATTRPVSGSGTLAIDLPADAAIVTAGLNRADAWPENDSLWLRTPPPIVDERWWVGDGLPPAGYKRLAPGELPAEGAAYLAPSVIVLANVAAGEVSGTQRRLIEQYVRDLGGALLILGGDRAFAAGDYVGTSLESLSPLASTPPSPTMHWIVLADASGSMAGEAAGATKWELENRAMLGVLAQLPPDDPLSIGSFSEDLRWWSTGRSVRETVALRLPPPGVAPGGPTNLEPALTKVIASVDAGMPKQILLMTDAETEITDPAALRKGLVGKEIHLHVLAIGRGNATPVLRDLAAASGGQYMESIDPKSWAGSIEKLARAAAPNRLMRQRVEVRFTGEAAAVGTGTSELWNRTWAKKSAATIAEAAVNGETIPMGARWNVGEGTVMAVAFSPAAEKATKLAKLVARLPRDPRLKIRWQTGREVRVRIDAAEAGAYLNDLSFVLEIAAAPGSPAQTRAVPQAGPGRYELAVPSSQESTVVTVRHGGRAVDRRVLAGRYAAEFDYIGTDEESLKELARRTGGALVPPSVTAPLDFAFPRRQTPLAAWLAGAGALMIGLALARWQFG